MPDFKVTVTSSRANLGIARKALEEAGVQLHDAGWGRPTGEAASVVGPRVVAEIVAGQPEEAERRIRDNLPSADYTVVAEPL